MENGTSLDDLLSGSGAEEAPAIEQAEAAPQPETIGQPRGEDGKFAAKEEKGVEAAPEPQAVVPTADQPVPEAEYKALKEERRRRQEAEQRAEEATARIAALQAQYAQSQPQEPEADFWEDPQAFLAKQFDQFGNQMEQRIQQRQVAERIDMSEQVARGKYTDFDEKLAAFRDAARLNPALVQEMTRAPDPAEFAYGRGKTSLEIQRVGSLDEILLAERAKWEAEIKAAMPAASFPATTATDGSVGARSGPAWAGPTSLDDLLR
jgi:hypothetical protein